MSTVSLDFSNPDIQLSERFPVPTCLDNRVYRTAGRFRGANISRLAVLVHFAIGCPSAFRGK